MVPSYRLIRRLFHRRQSATQIMIRSRTEQSALLLDRQTQDSTRIRSVEFTRPPHNSESNRVKHCTNEASVAPSYYALTMLTDLATMSNRTFTVTGFINLPVAMV
ncbi:hypothetical protein KIN20_006357 [Parelaphostrongylus tenuis]|uniref:Uncharacterized protein n=1 Tax=Parelaphostrongylus tenuis TaxID=148309 RepID=A0AAD5MU11_PARTN|nr:hypothetical protein KIN20_006357 [Parelaphostrongylus tenuis]